MTSFEAEGGNDLNVPKGRSYMNIFFGFVVGSIFFMTYYFSTKNYYNYFVYWNDFGALGYPIISLIYVLLPSGVVFLVFKFLKKQNGFRKGLLWSLVVPFVFLLFVFTMMFFGATNDYYYQEAVLGRDSSYCDKIEVSSIRESCLQSVFFVVNDYYFQKAVSGRDSIYCDDMTMPEHTIVKCRMQVESGDNTPLKLCEGSDSCRHIINDDYLYGLAVDLDEKYYCSQIDSSRKKKRCYDDLGLL